MKSRWALPALKQTHLATAAAATLAMVIHDAGATVRHVDNCNSDGAPGTLGYEIVHADAGDTIDLTDLTCGRISTLGFSVFKDVNLIGPGRDALILDGHLDYRVFTISAGVRFSASELTIANGVDRSDDAEGGCIASYGHVDLTNVVVTNCFASGQSSGRGGGIRAQSLTLVRSVVSGNLAYGRIALGGGVALFGGDLVMHDSIVSGNEARSAPGPVLDSFGGGVVVGSNYERAEISGSTISGNRAAIAAGMKFQSSMPYVSSLSMINSTVSGNIAEKLVGGVYSSMYTSIHASTIAFNTAGYASDTNGESVYAGLHVADAPVNVSATIISNNAAGGMPSDFSVSGKGLFLIVEWNIIQSSNVLTPPGNPVDPMLRPLAFNGGPTPTHAIAAGSAAIDAGPWGGTGTLFDQRGQGFYRRVGAEQDIGAYEYQGDSVFADGFDPGSSPMR
ncbi:hypothetical protein FHW12_002522 [Dokdonella fugitiva]|uniref:Parallel beta helix pectate lyase-like protein n=1 Tax=Dokdonella fugitiva TaxID=328517 RepID=A0A839F434_9GAMM|nr:choice-of-anchor Q domain-containing protein [Dokdonella fugitiva]MBA8888298.1 hypothetical protein [Dokdonella fugitiva]